MSGSVGLGASGKLTLMVGGEAADLERARPVLDALAQPIFHLGPLGTGAAMKLAVNTLIFGLNEALAEGLVLAERGRHRPRARLRRPRRERRRGAVRRLQARGLPRARRHAGGLPLDLAAKDLRLIAELADAVWPADAPGRRSTSSVIRAAERGDRGDADFSSVASHLREEGRR